MCGRGGSARRVGRRHELFVLLGTAECRCALLCGHFGWDSPRKRLFLSRNKY
eukprot:COSAG01_NODE_3013_length_6721_cov_2.328602_9_plen_52_part_00